MFDDAEDPDSDGDAGSPESPGPPQPVTPDPPPRSGKNRGGPRPTLPTPVRAGLDHADAVDAAGVVSRETVELDVEGETLAVKVRGRSRGVESAHLLLLGFHRDGQEEPVREALAVGEELEALGRNELLAAWERGRDPRDPFDTPPLFPGTRRSRNR